MPSKHIQLVNGKLVKHKPMVKEPPNDTVETHSVTNIEKSIVDERNPEVLVAGEGFNGRSFAMMRPTRMSSTATTTNRVNSDLVSGLGLLNFGSSLKNTKSKNIKLII